MNNRALFLMGFWLLLLQFFRLPESWKGFLLYATAFSLLAAAFLHRAGQGISSAETFIESNGGSPTNEAER